MRRNRPAVFLVLSALTALLAACPLSEGPPPLFFSENPSSSGPSTGNASSSSAGSPNSSGQNDSGSSSASNGSSLSDEEVAAILFVDSDGDGLSDLEELALGLDPFNPIDGPDIDGDGIPNGEDPDVDGDDIPNGEDRDVDGDGIPNEFDDDIDADGLLNAEDDDADGDGINDDEDNDDNADGEDDCECEHGTCSAFGGLCLCEPGWEGEDCDKFHCRDLRNCNHGTCTGPNTCRCNSGWESVGSIPCAVYHCRNLRNCNGHGTCIGPDQCQCDSDWQGLEDCSIRTCDRNPAICDDGDPCTIDECHPRDGCSNEPIVCSLFEECINGTCTTACTNSSGCEEGQGCRDGGCFDCQDDGDCRDGDPCTIDECDPQSGCLNEQLPCPLFEVCVRGRCTDICNNDGDCPSDSACKDGGCLKECESDSDCDDEETCDDDGVCVPQDQEEDDAG